MNGPLTLFDRLWSAHEILRRDDGASLLWVDRHYVHEGSHHAFARLAARGMALAHPALTVGVADHYVPTRGREAADADIARMIRTLEDNATARGFRLFGQHDPRQGIVHVVGPEQGLTLPGMLVVCGDSHTATHGALGAYAFGIGATEVAHVLATQTIWQRKPRRMGLSVEGRTGPAGGANDIPLNSIARLGADGGRGHAIEYAGAAVRALSVEGRLTLCNLSIEGGARSGLIAPDETLLNWLRGRPFAPDGAAWDRAAAEWLTLASDRDAAFDREEGLDAAESAPGVTWGTSPEDALPITGTLPDPERAATASDAARIRAALDYMGLRAGQRLEDVAVDQIFIGSCTNARIEDLRSAAAVLSGRRARVPGLVSPGSALVKAQAEQEGLDRIFVAAGLEWAGSGCSMCVGMNGDIVPPGNRCASTTNRNFRGRQGPGSRTHLMSPAMAAAAAVTGRLADVRPLLSGRDV
ncbi:MAG: 3-isopropylmalate dehydratase large subunit [Rhodobacteraceae bacterium]|nr:3-isopropylmalate dehydratase large subunit [Paracoccaceae bacterium]